MKATEGNGGPPIILGKEPVSKPLIIRGSAVVLQDEHRHSEPGQRITFESREPGFVITYHAIRVVKAGTESGYPEVFIEPLDVVTWEKLAS